MTNWSEFLDEKVIGILAIGTIAIISLFRLEDPTAVATTCVAAIAGFVTGKALEVAKK